MTLVRSAAHARYPATNIRARCNGRKVPTTDIVYRSFPGYVGEDAFIIEVISSIGVPQLLRYRVIIR